jgi:hypothetical protein
MKNKLWNLAKNKFQNIKDNYLRNNLQKDEDYLHEINIAIAATTDKIRIYGYGNFLDSNPQISQDFQNILINALEGKGTRNNPRDKKVNLDVILSYSEKVPFLENLASNKEYNVSIVRTTNLIESGFISLDNFVISYWDKKKLSQHPDEKKERKIYRTFEPFGFLHSHIVEKVNGEFDMKYKEISFRRKNQEKSN